jgi:hypothetical protein
MKISFSKCDLVKLLIKKQDTSRIILFVIIGFCVVAGGSYLLRNLFGLIPIIILGITGILIGGGVSVAVYWSKVYKTPSAPAKRSFPQITSGWDYRPRKAIRRYATVDGAPAREAVDLVNSNPSEANTSDDVWFSFIDVDPATRDAATNPPIPGEGRAVSAYG